MVIIGAEEQIEEGVAKEKENLHNILMEMDTPSTSISPIHSPSTVSNQPL